MAEMADQPHSFAASGLRIDEPHRLQSGAGKGPAVEALRYNEARQRVREIAARPIRGELDARQLRGHQPARGRRRPGRPPLT